MTAAWWCCPRCRAPLPAVPGGDAAIACGSCAGSYEVVCGIPDLRVPAATWIDFDRDRAQARRLAALLPASAERLAREVFQARPGWTEARTAWRTQQVLEGPARARRELDGWLAPVVRAGAPLLEVGCGTGGFLASLPESSQPMGVDVSLTWLVVARQLLREHGRDLPLAAAVAEALPVAGGSARAIVALDVVEHLGDPAAVFREVDRVAASGAALAFATPNRFSLGAEPHVGVWGVGWLPRPLQARYVKWRTGEAYDFARLVSAREAVGLVRSNSRFVVRADVPVIPQEELARFGPRRAVLGRAYNAVARLPVMRLPLLWVGPFFHVTGVKTD